MAGKNYAVLICEREGTLITCALEIRTIEDIVLQVVIRYHYIERISIVILLRISSNATRNCNAVILTVRKRSMLLRYALVYYSTKQSSGSSQKLKALQLLIVLNNELIRRGCTKNKLKRHSNLPLSYNKMRWKMYFCFIIHTAFN